MSKLWLTWARERKILTGVLSGFTQIKLHNTTFTALDFLAKWVESSLFPLWDNGSIYKGVNKLKMLQEMNHFIMYNIIFFLFSVQNVILLRHH